MHQPATLAGADRIGHDPRAEGRGKRHISTGERLAHTHHIRCHTSVLAGEQRAGAPEARGDLVEHQQHPCSSHSFLSSATHCGA